jgi:hypothetical protein
MSSGNASSSIEPFPTVKYFRKSMPTMRASFITGLSFDECDFGLSLHGSIHVGNVRILLHRTLSQSLANDYQL